MKVCPKCHYIDYSQWRQNRWRTNVEFLSYLDYPEDVDSWIPEQLKSGKSVVCDELYCYRLSGPVIERILRQEYEAGSKEAFHIPREHVDHSGLPDSQKNMSEY